MESQDRSVEARPCGELGEESTIETGLPLGDHLQELPSRFQRCQTFGATRFVRIDVAIESMANGIGTVLQDHGPRFIERPRQAAQPTQEPPDQTVIDHRLMRRQRGCGWRLLDREWIADQTSIVPYALAIGEAGPFNVFFGSGHQAGSGKSLIRQYENRGSR